MFFIFLSTCFFAYYEWDIKRNRQGLCAYVYNAFILVCVQSDLSQYSSAYFSKYGYNFLGLSDNLDDELYSVSYILFEDKVGKIIKRAGNFNPTLIFCLFVFCVFELCVVN